MSAQVPISNKALKPNALQVTVTFAENHGTSLGRNTVAPAEQRTILSYPFRYDFEGTPQLEIPFGVGVEMVGALFNPAQSMICGLTIQAIHVPEYDPDYDEDPYAGFEDEDPYAGFEEEDE
jgi:hypothetical protein